MRKTDEELAAAYLQNVGKPHANLPEDHPDHWQWEYRGTAAEREEMKIRLGLVEPEDPVVIEGQEEMFGGKDE